jgi:hypothetical protein
MSVPKWFDVLFLLFLLLFLFAIECLVHLVFLVNNRRNACREPFMMKNLIGRFICNLPTRRRFDSLAKYWSSSKLNQLLEDHSPFISWTHRWLFSHTILCRNYPWKETIMLAVHSRERRAPKYQLVAHYKCSSGRFLVPYSLESRRTSSSSHRNGITCWTQSLLAWWFEIIRWKEYSPVWCPYEWYVSREGKAKQ